MQRFLVMVAVAMMTVMTVQAQIPAEVKDILKKCSEKNHYSGGAEMDIKLHVSDNMFVFDQKKYPNAVVVRK